MQKNVLEALHTASKIIAHLYIEEHAANVIPQLQGRICARLRVCQQPVSREACQLRKLQPPLRCANGHQEGLDAPPPPALAAHLRAARAPAPCTCIAWDSNTKLGACRSPGRPCRRILAHWQKKQPMERAQKITATSVSLHRLVMSTPLCSETKYTYTPAGGVLVMPVP